MSLYLMNNFIVYSIVFYLLIFLGFFLKLVINKRLNDVFNNSFLSVFLSLTIAFLVISSICAIILTKFFTILILIPVILIFFCRKKISLGEKLNFKIFFFYNRNLFFKLIIIQVLSFFYLYFLLGNVNSSENLDVYFDFYHYGMLSRKLFDSGVETPLSLFSNYIEVHRNSFYHFSECWFTGFIGKFSSLDDVSILLFVSYPILFCISIIGGVGILKKISAIKNEFLLILIVFLIFIGISFYLPYFDSNIYQNASSNYNYLLFSIPGFSKIIVIIPLFICAFLCLYDKENIYFLCFCVLSVFCYNTLIPGVFGGMVFYLIYFCFSNFRKLKILGIRNIVIQQTSIILLFLFFIIIFKNLLMENNVNAHLNSEYSFKSILILIFEYNISPYIIYVFLPFSIIIALLSSNIFSIPFVKYSLVFLIASHFSSSIFIILNNGLDDIYQVLTNLLFPLFVVITFFIIALIKNKKHIYFVLSLLILSSCFNLSKSHEFNAIQFPKLKQVYSKKFSIDVFQEINNCKNNGLIKWAYITDHISNYWAYNSSFIGKFILTNKRMDFPLDISSINSENIINWCDKYNNELHPICDYKNGNQYLFTDYIEKTKLRYLLVENSLLIPEFIKNKLLLVSKDNHTGHLFFRIKQ